MSKSVHMKSSIGEKSPSKRGRQMSVDSGRHIIGLYASSERIEMVQQAMQKLPAASSAQLESYQKAINGEEEIIRSDLVEHYLRYAPGSDRENWIRNFRSSRRKIWSLVFAQTFFIVLLVSMLLDRNTVSPLTIMFLVAGSIGVYMLHNMVVRESVAWIVTIVSDEIMLQNFFSKNPQCTTLEIYRKLGGVARSIEESKKINHRQEEKETLQHVEQATQRAAEYRDCILSAEEKATRVNMSMYCVLWTYVCIDPVYSKYFQPQGRGES